MPRFLVLHVAGLALSLCALVAAALLSPDPRGHGTHEQMGLSPCRYLVATGRPCISCGLTTSYSWMARARVVDAWRANPAGIPLFLVTLATPLWIVSSWRRREDPLRFLGWRRGRFLPLLLFLCVMASWLLRGGLG